MRSIPDYFGRVAIQKFRFNFKAQDVPRPALPHIPIAGDLSLCLLDFVDYLPSQPMLDPGS